MKLRDFIRSIGKNESRKRKVSHVPVQKIVKTSGEIYANLMSNGRR